jgi:hypothetical protein
LLIADQPVPGVDKTIRRLNTPLMHLNSSKYDSISNKIPFLLLSNGGGTLEEEKAQDMNDIIGIQHCDYTQIKRLISLIFPKISKNYASLLIYDYKLTSENVILAHTPFRQLAEKIQK